MPSSSSWWRLLGLAALAAPGAAEVVTLTADNFEHLTQAATGATTGDWMVKFYAPWCGHCKKMAPTWEAFAEEMEGTYVNVADVDVTANRALGKRFGVKGFPTLKFFSKGQVYTYTGARNIEAFKAFVEGGYKSMSGSTVPGSPGMMASLQASLEQIQKNVAPLVQGENATVLVVGIVIGVTLCSILFICFSPSPKPAKWAPSEAADEDDDDVIAERAANEAHPKTT